ncbi:MAG: glycosyltransferase family 4 protein [bacterium]|nr:glycosyltransferase family 4 protein [bacterium]
MNESKHLNILQIVHYFLPDHQAGTELYTYYLSKELINRGNKVSILTFEDGYPFVDSAMEKTFYNEIPLIRVFRQQRKFQKRQLKKYMKIYEDHFLNWLFEKILDDLKPDIIHIQHLYNLSINFISLAKKRGIPIVMTIHDFWYMCWNNLLLKSSGKLCTPKRKLKECLNCIKKDFISIPMLPYFYYNLIKRESLFRKNLQKPDLIISPSKFLREQYIKWGVAPDKIIYSPNGHELTHYKDVSKAGVKKDTKLSFGFIGSILPQKGLDVLIKAFNSIPPENASLEIWGCQKTLPKYTAYLKSLIKNPSISFKGRYENPEIGNILSRFNALVIPSIWYENAPLTINEAFIFGIPVIASNIGGMAEHIIDGKNGLLFNVNDPGALKKILMKIINREINLNDLTREFPKVKDIRDNAEEIEGYYSQILKTLNK